MSECSLTSCSFKSNLAFCSVRVVRFVCVCVGVGRLLPRVLGCSPRCWPRWEEGEASGGGATSFGECSDSRRDADQAGVTRCGLFCAAVLLLGSSCSLYPRLKRRPKNPQAKELKWESQQGYCFGLLRNHVLLLVVVFLLAWAGRDRRSFNVLLGVSFLS